MTTTTPTPFKVSLTLSEAELRALISYNSETLQDDSLSRAVAQGIAARLTALTALLPS